MYLKNKIERRHGKYDGPHFLCLLTKNDKEVVAKKTYFSL